MILIFPSQYEPTSLNFPIPSSTTPIYPSISINPDSNPTITSTSQVPFISKHYPYH